MKKTRTALSIALAITGAVVATFTPIAYRWVEINTTRMLGDEYTNVADEFAHASALLWIMLSIAAVAIGITGVIAEYERNDS